MSVGRVWYFDALDDVCDRSSLNIVVGLRGCGKTSMLRDFCETMSAKDHRSVIWLDSGKGDQMRDGKKLLSVARDRVSIQNDPIVVLDNVQEVKGWADVAKALLEKGLNVYVIGSTKDVLLDAVGANLPSQYLEVTPLSFREYACMRPRIEEKTLLKDYMEYGGLPAVAILIDDKIDLIPTVISGMYSTALRDVVGRNEVRDMALMDALFVHLMKNIARSVSVRKVVSCLSDTYRKTSTETMDTYIKHLESAFLIYRSKKFDVISGEYLRTADKFYASDVGLRNNTVGYSEEEDKAAIIENLVYLELMRRSDSVSTGMLNGKEVDFVAFSGEERKYYQVHIGRDIRSLEKAAGILANIPDKFPKTVITLDDDPASKAQGVRSVGISDFLTGRD
ncbi:MAG: ATP-binding protein [Candidatus Methanoplasma sp.]|nr:ATP-binding protein [Candidatus Methanoplasma sp.]